MSTTKSWKVKLISLAQKILAHTKLAMMYSPQYSQDYESCTIKKGEIWICLLYGKPLLNYRCSFLNYAHKTPTQGS